MISIFLPRMPPLALICSIASSSAWMDPVSLMAMVPVALCNWPTVTVVSVTASAREPLGAGLLEATAALAVPSIAWVSLLQPSSGLAKSSDNPTSARAMLPPMLRGGLAMLGRAWGLGHVIFSTFRRSRGAGGYGSAAATPLRAAGVHLETKPRIQRMDWLAAAVDARRRWHG